MRKYIIAGLVVIGIFLGIYLLRLTKDSCPLRTISTAKKNEPIKEEDSLKRAFTLLKNRKDNEALLIFDKILTNQPDNLDALWGKAEVLRRNYKFKEAEELLSKVLAKYPSHASSLISMLYIKYHDNRFEDARELLTQVFNQPDLDRENKALAYMLMGSINAKKASLGGWISKVTYGMRIKTYFEKAKSIAPDLSEVHLGLGSFYLLAPKIAGGNLDKAIAELQEAVRLTPDFATANARLAQAYKKKGDSDKYNQYISRAKEINPENEVLKTLEE